MNSYLIYVKNFDYYKLLTNISSINLNEMLKNNSLLTKAKQIYFNFNTNVFVFISN